MSDSREIEGTEGRVARDTSPETRDTQLPEENVGLKVRIAIQEMVGRATIFLVDCHGVLKAALAEEFVKCQEMGSADWQNSLAMALALNICRQEEKGIPLALLVPLRHEFAAQHAVHAAGKSSAEREPAASIEAPNA